MRRKELAWLRQDLIPPSLLTACQASYPISILTRLATGSIHWTVCWKTKEGTVPGSSCSSCLSEPGRVRSAYPHCAAAITSTPFHLSPSHGSRATSTSSAGFVLSSDGMRRSWSAKPTARGLRSAVTSRPTRVPPACTRSASTTSSAARIIPAAVTTSSSRAMRLPASMLGRTSKDGSPPKRWTLSGRRCRTDRARGFPPIRTPG